MLWYVLEDTHFINVNTRPSPENVRYGGALSCAGNSTIIGKFGMRIPDGACEVSRSISPNSSDFS